MRTVDEIATYLITEMNEAIRRPGMYGGEPVLRTMLRHLEFVTDISIWSDEEREAEGASNSRGVTGAFEMRFPSEIGDAFATVYADQLRLAGWLKLDRLLLQAEYKELKEQLAEWCATDRTWPEVTDRFGPPSVQVGGSNPYYGKSLGYACESPGQPIVWFHLWNGSDPSTPDVWPTYEQAVLLAARCGSPFDESFVLTPEGQRRRPS